MLETSVNILQLHIMDRYADEKHKSYERYGKM